MIKVLEGFFGNQGEAEFSIDLDVLTCEGVRRILPPSSLVISSQFGSESAATGSSKIARRSSGTTRVRSRKTVPQTASIRTNSGTV